MTTLPQLHFADKDAKKSICGKTKGICTEDQKVFYDYLTPCGSCLSILSKREVKKVG